MNEPATPTWFDRASDFIKREPLSALLLATIVATFVYFFGFVPLFVRGTFVSGVSSVFSWGGKPGIQPRTRTIRRLSQ